MVYNMDPAYLKTARCSLGFATRKALADALGVSTRAVDSWEQGWRPIPAWVHKFLTCIENQIVRK